VQILEREGRKYLFNPTCPILNPELASTGSESPKAFSVVGKRAVASGWGMRVNNHRQVGGYLFFVISKIITGKFPARVLHSVWLSRCMCAMPF
jgi:hypothetical protein